MGKKTKTKTRWRTLSIDLGPSSNGHDKNYNHTHSAEDTVKLSSTAVNTETKVYFNEDEYTKITTPRQDVLFKKGYFARRVHQLAAANLLSAEAGLTSGYEVPNGDYLEDDYIIDDYEGQSFYNSAPYVDPSTPMYYNYGNNSYEVYDPFTGSMTVLMGPQGHYAPPNPGQPLPPMPVDWYNQQTPYYPSSKTYSGDSSHAYTSPESLCPPTSPQDLYEDPTLYPQSFIYPGYMLSNNYHTTGTGGIPVLTSPPQTSSCDSSNFKKRKRRKKRKKEGTTEEEYEYSSEDQCSQSGASEQLDSKTTSDSGVHTHNSGESTPVTPPLSISFYPHAPPYHPIPAFTSTDEDSATTSMPYYNPYHQINYNYTSDSLAPVTSVIDPHYVMHKSKKLKGKRPKADLNKFFPSTSQNAGPCSYHSSVPSSLPPPPPPKQLTILKPEMTRKIPPSQITILKHSTTVTSQNESLAKYQSKEFRSLPLSQNVAEYQKCSEKSVSTKNITNVICPNTNSSNEGPGVNRPREKNDVHNGKSSNDTIQSKDDITVTVFNERHQIYTSNKTDSNIHPPKRSVIQSTSVDIPNTAKNSAVQEVISDPDGTESRNVEKIQENRSNPKREISQTHDTCQLNARANLLKDQTAIKPKEKLMNGHLEKSEDNNLNRTPSPTTNPILTNGFHPNENKKPIQNCAGKSKQKSKAKKIKSNSNETNATPINSCDENNARKNDGINEDLKNGVVDYRNEKKISINDTEQTSNLIKNGFKRIVDENCSKKIEKNVENHKGIIDSRKNLEKNCLEKNSLTNMNEFQNGFADSSMDDTFETCSNKSEELEELYIKNNPLLAKLVDMKSINNNEQNIKDKNRSTNNNAKLSLEKHQGNVQNDHASINGKTNDTVTTIDTANAKYDIQDTENKETIKSSTVKVNTELGDNTLIKKSNSFQNETKNINGKDIYSRLNDTEIVETQESNKKDNESKRDEEKTQPIVNTINVPPEVKEEAPKPTAPNEHQIKTGPIKENGDQNKSNESSNKVLEKQDQTKFQKKNKSKSKSEKQGITKERVSAEKKVTFKESISPEKESLTNEEMSDEKPAISNGRISPGKETISKENPSSNKQVKRISPDKETKSKEKIPLKKQVVLKENIYSEKVITTKENSSLEKRIILMKRITPEKETTSKAKPLTDEQVISKERTSPEKQTATKERISLEKQVISKQRRTSEKQAMSQGCFTVNQAIPKQRISPSLEQNSKRKNSKKKLSPPPVKKSNKKESAVNTAHSFIDDMLSEAVNKVKMKLESSDAVRKKETAHVITPDIPLQAKTATNHEVEAKSNQEPNIDVVKEVKETKSRKLSRQNSNKSIKSPGKSKVKSPERRAPSEPAASTLQLTDVVTKWLQEEHGGKLPVDYLDDEDDEIFVQPDLKTGSKNSTSNPSRASFPRGITARDRVANRTSDISDRCNAKDCVSKYYNLGIRTSPETEVTCSHPCKEKEKEFKYLPGPLPPCGICCMIQ